MTSAAHAVYKHVPGMCIRKSMAQLLPDRFGSDQLSGEWLYDQEADLNRRVK